MNIDRNTYRRIENYLQNRLNETDRKAFEDQMEENPTLRQEVETYRLLIEGVQRKAFQEAFGEDIKRMHQEWDHKQAEPKIRFLYQWQTYAVAAAVVLLLLVYFWPPSLYKQLALGYYTPDAAIGRTLGSKPQLEYDGDEFYERENYSKAKQTYQQSLKTTPDHRPLQYRMGLVNMATDNYQEAISYFLQIIPTDTLLYPKSRWYVALAYLACNEAEMADEVLRDLAKFSNKQYARKAEGLLREMEDLRK